MNMLNKIKSFAKENIWVYPLAVGAVLRLYKITASSIWHDEGYTMWLLRYNFVEIIERTARDVHPPGYYLIAKPWVMVLGNSEFAIRMLSVTFSLGIVFLVYKIIEKLFSSKEAFWTSMLVALSPFMIRFAQEARMYGVVAFFTTLATYFLIKIIKDKQKNLFIPYTLSMLVAIYTQYYAFFIVIVHWLIVAISTPEFFSFKWAKSFKERIGIFNLYWWGANLGIFAGYLAWFPVAYKQVTRVSGSYWIKPEWINARTIPGNALQFIFYDHLDFLYNSMILGAIVWWLLIAVLIGVSIYALKNKNKKAVIGLLIFGYLPMTLVFILSKLKTPVYQDRYFPFSAVALFAVWGIFIAQLNNKYVKYIIVSVAIISLIIGNYVMHFGTNHQMKALSEKVNETKKEGDAVFSGELYTFLDGSYYFGDKKIKLISESVDGYGESSLFYDQQKDYVVRKSMARGSSKRIFVIGKTGDKDYFSKDFWNGFKSEIVFDEGDKPNGLKAVLYTR